MLSPQLISKIAGLNPITKFHLLFAFPITKKAILYQEISALIVLKTTRIDWPNEVAG